MKLTQVKYTTAAVLGAAVWMCAQACFGQAASVKELFGSSGQTSGALICWQDSSGAHGVTCSGTTIPIGSAGAWPQREQYLRGQAGACITTGGCTAGAQSETATNKINYTGPSFADAATQCWQIDYGTATSLASSATFRVRADWIPDSDVTGGDVVWSTSIASVGDGEAVDQAFGTAVVVTDSWISSGALHLSAVSADITAGGTISPGDHIWVQVCRSGAAAGDTLAGGSANAVALIGVDIRWPFDSLSAQ